MFCPDCGFEYFDDSTECRGCKIPLVQKLPQKGTASVKYKTITSNLRQDEISFIKSMLTARGIAFAVQGELFGTIRQVPSTIRLVVAENQYEEALALLKDFM